MAQITTETVTDVRHWNSELFSFKTTRNPGFRFENGHFVMLGLEIDGKPLMRAYSIASANHEESLEFFSIKVPDGPLTSQLQHLTQGDQVLLSTKPTGTLIADNLLEGGTLYLLATGTGLAPFLSIIQDPHVYDRFDKVVLVHGVRHVSDLAYRDFLEDTVYNNAYFGDKIKEKFIYYPTVTREAFENQGRVTDAIDSDLLSSKLKSDKITTDNARFMLCGSPAFLKDMQGILDKKGFTESRHGKQATYVIERAFVEK